MIDFRLGLPRVTRRAGRLEEPNRTELRSVGGIAAKAAMGGAAYSAQFARTGSFSGKGSELTPWACGIRGGWHFHNIVKTALGRGGGVRKGGFQRELSTAESRDFPSTLTGRIQRSYVPTESKAVGAQTARTSNRESSRMPEARRRQLKYQMSFIVV